MTFERSPAGAGPAAEPAPTPSPTDATGGGTPLALQLQVLSTEHWSLLASRSLAWNESFSRAGMYVSTLTGSIVALALVAQASDFGEGFRIFALVILPVVLFVGLTTLLRLGIANYHDGITVLGMNRIRAAYFERVPEVRRYFVMPGNDDDPALWRAMGMDMDYPLPLILLASAPNLINVLNAVVAGAIAAIAALQLGTDTSVALVAAAITFVAVYAVELWFGQREATRARPELAPMFPSGPGEPNERPELDRA